MEINSPKCLYTKWPSVRGTLVHAGSQTSTPSLSDILKSDLPWFTSQENEQRAQELHYVNSRDSENNKWRDLRRLEFRREVLDKYKDNELCMVDNDSISFLRKEGKTPASTVAFRIKVSDSGRIVVEIRDFIYVPPIERIHWLSHQINR
jgi:hypothetical protein